MSLKRLRRLALVAAVTPLGQLSAQATGTVYGAVLESCSGQPLVRVNVSVRGTRVHATTGSGGAYRLDGIPAGSVTLDAKMIGFKPGTDSLVLAGDDSARVDLRLSGPRCVGVDYAHPDTLTPVIVTAAKRSQLLDQAVTSVALVTQSDVAHRAVNTVDEAVDKAPGVQFLNGQVNLRGSSGYVQGLGSRVLLLVDGVPANQADRGGINWDIVPLAEVERVEVVKGAGSSLYGSAAFGGVVNVITREIPTGWHGQVRASAGSYANPPHAEWRFRDFTGGHEGLDISASYGTDLLRGSLAAGGWHSDGYREQDRRDHWQAAGKTVWHASAMTQVAAAAAWASDQYEVPFLWCTRGNCDDRGQTYQPFMIDGSGRGAFTRSDKGYVTAMVARTPTASLSWQARGSWVRTNFTDYQPDPERDDFAAANRVGAELRGIIQPAGNRVVTVGAEAAHSDVRTNIFTGDTSSTSTLVRTHTQSEFAAYAESEQRFGKARVTAGTRIDYIAVDGGGLQAVVSPRVGAVLQAGPSAWRASAGRGFRAATLAERFVSTHAFGFPVIPNPGLEPETAWSFELGHATTLRRVRVDAAVFWTAARDLIEPAFIVQGGTPKIQLQNVSRARLRGLDLSMAATPLTPRLATTLAYTFLDSRDLSRDTVLAFRPRHIVTASADYTWKSLGVGGDYRYASRIERIELDQFFLGDSRIASHVLDVRAQWSRDPVALHVLVTNVLNYIYNQVPRTLAPVRTLSVVATWKY